MKIMPWYAGWNMVTVAILFQAISVGTTYYGFTFWIGPWTREFDTGRAEIMVAIAGFTLVVGLVSPFVGRAMDRLSIRALVCTGASLLGLGFLLISLATAVWQIVLVYATLLAVGVSLTGPLPSQTLAVKWFRRRRGLATGIVVIGIPLGGLLLPRLMTWLFTTCGWRITHRILAGFVLLVIAIPAWHLIRNAPQETEVEPEAEAEPRAARPEAVDHGGAWTTRQILSQRVVWVLGIVLLILNVMVSAVVQNLGPRAEDLGIPLHQASFLVSALAGALIVGNFVFGALADRWDARHLYWLAAGLSALSTLLMMGSPSYPLLLGLCALQGFAEGCILPVMAAVVTRCFGPRAFGQVAGIVLLPVQAFGMFGAMLMAWIRDRSGSYDVALMVGLVAVMIAALLMAWLPKTKEQENPSPVSYEHES